MEPTRDKFTALPESLSSIIFTKAILCPLVTAHPSFVGTAPQQIYVTLGRDFHVELGLNAGICKNIVVRLVYCNSLSRVVVLLVDGGCKSNLRLTDSESSSFFCSL